jgi:hypothetical protein
MRTTDLRRRSDAFLDAWNRHDVEAVVASYTDPLVYRDPNTRGAIESHDALRRYLTKLFDRWEMHWSTGEVFPLERTHGAVISWHARFRRRGDDAVVAVDGIDLVLLDGEQIACDEVHFDRAVLAPLLAPR